MAGFSNVAVNHAPAPAPQNYGETASVAFPVCVRLNADRCSCVDLQPITPRNIRRIRCKLCLLAGPFSTLLVLPAASLNLQPCLEQTGRFFSLADLCWIPFCRWETILLARRLRPKQLDYASFLSHPCRSSPQCPDHIFFCFFSRQVLNSALTRCLVRVTAAVWNDTCRVKEIA
jgi:hypothetical protein